MFHSYANVCLRNVYSLAVNLEGSMTMDLHYETTQAKVKSKLYTSTAFEGTTEVKGYKFVTLVFDLPKTKSDIISIEYVYMYICVRP